MNRYINQWNGFSFLRHTFSKNVFICNIISFTSTKHDFKKYFSFHTFPYFEKKQINLILQLSDKKIKDNGENRQYLKIKKINESSKRYKSLIADLEIYKELIEEKEGKRKGKEEVLKQIMNDVDAKNLYQSLENVTETLFDEIIDFYKKYVNEDHHLDVDEIKMEIVPGVGGLEAKLFSKELFRMYQNYCHLQNYEYDIINKISEEIKGGRNLVCYIRGNQVYENFVHERGIHRVQRIPVNSKKIQTSTSIVLIFDEKTQINKIKNKIQFSKKDLIIETKRSGGPGGQSVNKSESCVKVFHKPTNISVEVQKTSSQIQNKNLAFELLERKLYNFYYEKEKEEFLKDKKNQKLSGDRSEKIRTYNFLHNIVTDHILNEEFYGIEEFF